MGERDIDEFQAIANHIARTIPRLTKLVMPGVGHMSNMEAPETFNEAVLGFLGNLEHPSPEMRHLDVLFRGTLAGSS